MNEIIFELKDVHFSYLGKYPALHGVDISIEKGQGTPVLGAIGKYPALCGVDIRIEKGQRIAIVGANGSGKSTLLHILNGLVFPDSGVVKFLGHELNEKTLDDEEFNHYFRSKVGLVFQNPDIQLLRPTVKEEIMFGPINFGFDHAAVTPVLDSIMEIFGIKDLIDRMPDQLSIGEKRKVAMASVLISGPDILLLDEPMAEVDPKNYEGDLIDLLNQYHEDGKTIITATRDMHIVEEMADVVYVLSHDKKIIRACPPKEILADIEFLQKNNPLHAYFHHHGGEIHMHPH